MLPVFRFVLHALSSTFASRFRPKSLPTFCRFDDFPNVCIAFRALCKHSRLTPLLCVYDGRILACSFLPLIVDRDRSDVCCRRCRIALRLAIIPPYLPSPTFAPHRIRKAPSLPFTQRLCNAQQSYKAVELAAQARERFYVRPEHKCPKTRALRRLIFSARLLLRPKPCFAASRRLILPPLFPHSPHLCSTRTTRRPSGIEAPV